MKKVSVIIVNYNGERHLEPCLRSLLELDYPKESLELIVFDNGSQDRSVELVKDLCPRARIMKSPRNLGFAAPHRMAARAAEGEILAFLNNDMRVEPLWVSKGVEPLDPESGLVCSSSVILGWDGSGIEFSGGSLQYLGYADQLRDRSSRGEILFPCGGAMFIYKDVFERVGCFDDDYFAIFEDVDLGWRLWIMGYRVALSPESRVMHRGHGTLKTQRRYKMRYLMHRNALMTIIKNYEEENLARILPVALALAVKRALVFMNVDKRAFYFWEEKERKGPSVPADFEEGCIHLAALDDVFSSWTSLREKRREVQSRRRRGDKEIFSLFKDPFRNIMGSFEYLVDEALLFGGFGLERLFGCEEEYEARLDELIRLARESLQARSEGPAPPVPSRAGLLRKFLESAREGGLREALRRTALFLARRL